MEKENIRIAPKVYCYSQHSDVWRQTERKILNWTPRSYVNRVEDSVREQQHEKENLHSPTTEPLDRIANRLSVHFLLWVESLMIYKPAIQDAARCPTSQMTQTETSTIKYFPLTLTFSSRLCQKILLPVKEIGRNVYIASMNKVTAWEVHNMNRLAVTRKPW